MSTPNLAALQSYRARLFEALGGGARSLTDQNGEQITFRSVREIQAALATINAEIAAIESGKPINVVRFRPTKGT